MGIAACVAALIVIIGAGFYHGSYSSEAKIRLAEEARAAAAAQARVIADAPVPGTDSDRPCGRVGKEMRLMFPFDSDAGRLPGRGWVSAYLCNDGQIFI